MAASGILSNHTYRELVENEVCSQVTADVLETLGYTILTKIQSKVFRPILKKKNCYIQARTGSGKTLAYLVPMLERLKAMDFKESKSVVALVVSPTRELAHQIAHLLEPLAAAHGMSTLTLTGGNKSKVKLKKGPSIAVGTVGRLLEYLNPSEPKSLPTKSLRIVILDEVDKTLNKGSQTIVLKEMCAFLPIEKTQKILVSATVDDKCTELAKSILQMKKDFKHISTETDASPTTEQIKQSYLSVRASDRLSMLITVLRTLRKKKVVVFYNSSHAVNFHASVLKHLELPVLHCVGKDKQKKRNKAFGNFCKLEQGILLSTGLAERGLDIEGIHWIIVYDPPQQPEDYIHRIGRSGRGVGRVGQALLFLRPEEDKFLNVLRNMKAEISELEFEGDLKAVQTEVMTLVKENEEIQKQAKLAYKKSVRTYQTHKLREIFNVNSLDLNEECKAFGFESPPLYLGHIK